MFGWVSASGDSQITAFMRFSLNQTSWHTRVDTKNTCKASGVSSEWHYIYYWRKQKSYGSERSQTETARPSGSGKLEEFQVAKILKLSSCLKGNTLRLYTGQPDRVV
jgi:hypothetical protein